MIDHERYRLLAAEAIAGPLAPDDERALRAHLATCHTCSAEAAGLARDHQALIGALADAPVSPRVRSAVFDAARGRRRTANWPLLAAAALLLVATVGAVAFVGGSPRQPDDLPAGVIGSATPTAPPSAVSTGSPTTVAPEPTATIAPPTPSESVASPSATASPAATGGGSVSGAYTYVNALGGARTNSVAVQADLVNGTWSRTSPANGRSYGGTVTCLVIDGADAWLAGPVTFASDGAEGLAAMLYVHDGGASRDRAVTWISDPGQTLATMETWCQTRFIPAGPFRVTEGDIVVVAP
ncbi:MAG TPA: hypothetical protein VIF84_04785 [Candidatus Limnocylindrales bacterium]